MKGVSEIERFTPDLLVAHLKRLENRIMAYRNKLASQPSIVAPIYLTELVKMRRVRRQLIEIIYRNINTQTQ